MDANYKMGDTVLGTTIKEGITISDDMKVSEGNQMLGLID